MGRKPLDDGMQKTLSLRVSERMVAFLENTRAALERSGERASTSEVARQVLDSIVDRDTPLGFSMDLEESLRGILRALRDDLPLTQHDYALLAETAHSAYLRTRRDFVRADLLLNNLAAFESYIKLRNDRIPHKVNADADRYYFGNLGSKAQNETNLIEAIHRARELIKEQGRPYRSTAEFMARNLTILRDDLGLASQDVDKALRPHANGLLLLALKEFARENDRPVDGVDDRHEMQDRLKIQAALVHHNDGFTFAFLDGNENLSVLVTPASREWYLSCSYQRFADFLQVVAMDRRASAEYFELEYAPMNDGQFRLSVKESSVGVGIFLSAKQMSQLRELIAVVMTNPEYQRVFALFELRYGAV